MYMKKMHDYARILFPVSGFRYDETLSRRCGKQGDVSLQRLIVQITLMAL